MNWRKPTRSGGQGGNCVEVANAARLVQVRDTKDRDGGTLRLAADAWRTFTEQIKAELGQHSATPERPSQVRCWLGRFSSG